MLSTGLSPKERSTHDVGEAGIRDPPHGADVECAAGVGSILSDGDTSGLQGRRESIDSLPIGGTPQAARDQQLADWASPDDFPPPYTRDHSMSEPVPFTRSGIGQAMGRPHLDGTPEAGEERKKVHWLETQSRHHARGLVQRERVQTQWDYVDAQAVVVTEKRYRSMSHFQREPPPFAPPPPSSDAVPRAVRTYSNVLRFFRRGKEKKRKADAVAKYREMLALLLNPDFAVLGVLNRVTPMDSMVTLAQGVLQIFTEYEMLERLVRRAVCWEVWETARRAVLFRGESLSIRMLVTLAKEAGLSFLKSIVGPLIEECVNNPPTHLEVDPSKISEGEDRDGNLKNLRDMTSTFLQSILGSVDQVPREIRWMLHAMWIESEAKFPGGGVNAASLLLFLRFICPSIISPETFRLRAESLPDTAHRPLLLTVKVIQQIANGLTYGQKEKYMTDMNPFVEEWIPKVQAFLRELADVDRAEEEEKEEVPYRPSLDVISPNTMATLRFAHALLRKHHAKVQPLGDTRTIFSYDHLVLLLEELNALGIDPTRQE